VTRQDQSTSPADNTEGKQAVDFTKWRQNTGMSREYWRSLFIGSEVGDAGNFYHPKPEEPEWTPDDFDFDNGDTTDALPETMEEGVETAEKVEASEHGTDSDSRSSSFSKDMAVEQTAEMEDSTMGDVGRTGPQDPSFHSHSPSRSSSGSPQPDSPSVAKAHSDVAMEEDETAMSQQESYEPTYDANSTQATDAPLNQTPSGTYDLASSGVSIAATNDTFIQAGGKRPERRYMMISNRELHKLAPNSSLEDQAKRPRRAVKYPR
jgi:hypothetical protein